MCANRLGYARRPLQLPFCTLASVARNTKRDALSEPTLGGATLNPRGLCNAESTPHPGSSPNQTYGTWRPHCHRYTQQYRTARYRPAARTRSRPPLHTVYPSGRSGQADMLGESGSLRRARPCTANEAQRVPLPLAKRPPECTPDLEGRQIDSLLKEDDLHMPALTMHGLSSPSLARGSLRSFAMLSATLLVQAVGVCVSLHGSLRVPSISVIRGLLPLCWPTPTARRPTATNTLPLFRANASSRHLDIGVATGYFTANHAFPAGSEVTLCDLNETCLETAAARFHATKTGQVCRIDVCWGRDRSQDPRSPR